VIRGCCAVRELRLLDGKLRWNDGEEPVGRLFRTVAILIAFADLGCGQPPRQANDENNFDLTPTGTPSDTGGSDTAPPPEAGGKLNKEQEDQMLVVLKRGGDKAARCPEVADGPTGEGEVQVLFDGQKGRVTDAVVGAPFAGTPIESCIKRAFIGEIVLPFAGEPKSVPYTVKLPDKKAAPAPDKKK
jgi:hypothetical protein